MEEADAVNETSLVLYLGRKLKDKHIVHKSFLEWEIILEVRVLDSIRNMQAGLQASFVISERPYNLEVDLLLKLVGREVCHMFSIHKYWLWLSCWLSLTLVGFHFGAQPLCNVSHLPTISFMTHVHVLGITMQSCFCCQTHVESWWSFYWFPN